MARYPAVEPATDYLGFGPGGPPGVPVGGITGVELGSGTGAGCTICGSTPSAGLMTPPLLSNLLLRLWFSSEVRRRVCKARPGEARGAQADRHELLKLLKNIIRGDVVTVTRIDRLA